MCRVTGRCTRDLLIGRVSECQHMLMLAVILLYGHDDWHAACSAPGCQQWYFYGHDDWHAAPPRVQTPINSMSSARPLSLTGVWSSINRSLTGVRIFQSFVAWDTTFHQSFADWGRSSINYSLTGVRPSINCLLNEVRSTINHSLTGVRYSINRSLTGVWPSINCSFTGYDLPSNICWLGTIFHRSFIDWGNLPSIVR